MRMTATIDSTGAVELDTAGQITRENHSTVGDARRAVMATAKTLAEQTSQDMQLHIEDPSGSRTFLVGADGTSRQESVAPAPATVESSAPVEPDESAEPASVPAVESVVSAPVEPVSAAELEPVEPASGGTVPAAAAADEQAPAAPAAAGATDGSLYALVETGPTPTASPTASTSPSASTTPTAKETP